MPGKAFTVAGAALILVACQSGDTGKPPSVSLDAAKQITAEFDGPSYVPPPRTITDILAILNEPTDDDTYVRELRAKLNAKPPDTDDPSQLSQFHLQRGRVAMVLGQMNAAIEDFERSLAYVETTARNDPSGRSARPRGLLRNLMTAHFNKKATMKPPLSLRGNCCASPLSITPARY